MSSKPTQAAASGFKVADIKNAVVLFEMGDGTIRQSAVLDIPEIASTLAAHTGNVLLISEQPLHGVEFMGRRG